MREDIKIWLKDPNQIVIRISVVAYLGMFERERWLQMDACEQLLIIVLFHSGDLESRRSRISNSFQMLDLSERLYLIEIIEINGT